METFFCIKQCRGRSQDDCSWIGAGYDSKGCKRGCIGAGANIHHITAGPLRKNDLKKL